MPEFSIDLCLSYLRKVPLGSSSLLEGVRQMQQASSCHAPEVQQELWVWARDAWESYRQEQGPFCAYFAGIVRHKVLSWMKQNIPCTAAGDLDTQASTSPEPQFRHTILWDAILNHPFFVTKKGAAFRSLLESDELSAETLAKALDVTTRTARTSLSAETLQQNLRDTPASSCWDNTDDTLIESGQSPVTARRVPIHTVRFLPGHPIVPARKEALAPSLLLDGQVVPAIVQPETLYLIDGHQRAAVLDELGVSYLLVLPLLSTAGLTAEQLRRTRARLLFEASPSADSCSSHLAIDLLPVFTRLTQQGYLTSEKAQCISTLSTDLQHWLLRETTSRGIPAFTILVSSNTEVYRMTRSLARNFPLGVIDRPISRSTRNIFLQAKTKSIDSLIGIANGYQRENKKKIAKQKIDSLFSLLEG